MNTEKDYASYSYWLEDAGESLVTRPRLSRSEEVDFAILGGGYSALWTAYYLLKQRPDLRVAIVEKDIVGFGGSGRNGGWCSPRFPVSAGLLEKRYGIKSACDLMQAVDDSSRDIQTVCEEESITAQYRAAGTLTLARSKSQLQAIQDAFGAYARLGLADRYKLLSPDETNTHIHVTQVLGSLYTPDGASLHPGRLVRGLARAVESRGGVIYEQTEVTDFISGADARLITPHGEIRAKQSIILAGEAYHALLQRLHRSILPVYSLICLTQPLTVQQWQQVGWGAGENVSSARNSVVYLTRTGDGRILFGSRGAPYRFSSRISDAQDRHKATIDFIQKSVTEWFPMLNGIEFTHNWGGPVAMPSDWMPSVRFDPGRKFAMLGGYTGQGVSTSHLAGKTLAGILTGRQSSLDRLPIVQHRSPRWISEPLRWLVVRYMQNALMRMDDADEAGARKPLDAPLAAFLGRH